jgi:hypothetical protein
MRSPAHNAFLGLVLAGWGLASCVPGPVTARGHDIGQDRRSETDWRDNFYGIRAVGSEGTRLEIQLEPGLEVRARAVLVQRGSTWTTTTSHCPRLTNALEAFRQLPALKPGPAALQPDLPAAIPVPPRPTGGESWTIRTSAYAPNWSSNEIVLHGLGGPYPFWVGETVEVIKACDPSPA